MRPFALAILTLALIAGVAMAQDLGNRPPVKAPPVETTPVPLVARQGGDTVFLAFTIPALPFTDTGTTIGYNDDYDEMCPYDAMARDVVYRFVSTMPQSITVDLCGSDFDTKVYIYDAVFHLVACNDDFYFDEPCGVYVSKLEEVPLGIGVYYLVVDGYGNSSGTYILVVENYVECVLACPDGGVPEGEPPLVPNYVDNWNGGCNTNPGHPFQAVTGDANGARILCGVAGWYTFQGSQYRDTDWYTLEMGVTGTIEIIADAEDQIYIFELLPQDCAAVDVAQLATAGDCTEVTMTIDGYAPGQTVWFWAGSTVFEPPAGEEDEYDYVVWFSGLAPAVATEATTWSSVKALYD